MIEGNELADIRPTGKTVSSEKLIIRDTGLTTINKEINMKIKEGEKKPKKVNSFITILSIWNSMIGSSTVSLSYNVYYCGIIPAFLLSIIYGLICFYTCKIYVDFGTSESDFSITVEKYFKKKFGDKISKVGKNIQILFSMLIALGAGLIYFLIISQNLYPIACLILNKLFGLEIDAKDLTPGFSRFSSFYLGILLSFVLFSLIVKKDIDFIVKLSSYGIYFISILIFFVLYTGISSIINTKFDFDYITNKLNSDKRHLKLFGENPALFAGTLSMAYFSHTTVLPVLKSNKNQKNNIRDLSLGYYFACFTFSFSGILGYIGFSGKNFDIEFKDNWFLFFDYDNYLVLLLRLLNVFQLITVFPIIIYVVRFQIFNYFYGNDYPGRTHIIIFGSIIIFLCLIVLYFCYNFLGKLIGFIGATTSLVLIYGFPPIIKMIDYYFKLNEDKNDENIHDNEKEKKLAQNIENENENDNKISEENKKNKFLIALFFIGQSLIIVVGIATVIFQFIPINFFNINLEE